MANTREPTGFEKQKQSHTNPPALAKQRWEYRECRQCYILWPHLTFPEVCVCGNDMKNNYNNKTLLLVEFEQFENTTSEGTA